MEREYLYVWADGVYPKAGPKDEQMAVLVVIGLNRKGEKELLAIEEGYRESADSWREVFRDLKRRGLQWIGMMIADGVPGLWKALRDGFPTARRQRCWVHKMRNILDKVPQVAYDEVLQALREIYHASGCIAVGDCSGIIIGRDTADITAIRRNIRIQQSQTVDHPTPHISEKPYIISSGTVDMQVFNDMPRPEERARKIMNTAVVYRYKPRATIFGLGG